MKKSLLFIIAIFSSCTSYKNLKTNNTEDFWKASFEDFTGKETLDFKAQEKKTVYLSSKLEHLTGELLLKNSDSEIQDTNVVNHNKLVLDKDYKLEIIGKKATGSFALKYDTYDVKAIQVAYNSNIELLALSNFLINYEDFESIPDSQTFNIEGKEVNVKSLYALNLKIANEFKPYLKSKNLEIIKSYFDKEFYLHYSNFVLNLNHFPDAKVTSETKFLNRFASLEDARKFTTAFNDFYKEIHFEKFLDAYQPYYKKMISEVSQNIPKENFITEMEHLFGKKVGHYNLYPSLTMPFSSGFAVGGEDSVGNVFGSFSKPENINEVSNLDLGFSNSKALRTICIHEFGHSFVNPAVDNVSEKIIQSSESFFEPVKNKMSEQGYNQWKICLYEHFDRANEVIVAKLIGDNKKANEILTDNVKNRAFIYLPQIIEKLEFWYYNEFFTKSYEQKVSEIISELKSAEIK